MLLNQRPLKVDAFMTPTAHEPLSFGVSRNTFSFLLNKEYKESDLLAVQATQQCLFHRLLQYRDDASPYARQAGTWGSSGSARLLSRP